MHLLWVIVGLYVAYGAAMIWLHPRFIYPFSQDSSVISGFERQTLTASDGVPIAVQVAQGDGPVLIYFMGNAGAISIFEPGLRPHVKAGRHVIAMEYRGGGGQPGHPSEERLKEDALMIADFALQLDKPVIVQGYSMGSGLAMHVAANRPVNGVLLAAPYSKMCQIMAERSYLPACILPFVQKWDSISLAPRVTQPVLILHGDSDSVVPARFSEALAGALPNAKRVIVPKAIHSDVGLSPESEKDITLFFETVAGR